MLRASGPTARFQIAVNQVKGIAGGREFEGAQDLERHAPFTGRRVAPRGNLRTWRCTNFCMDFVTFHAVAHAPELIATMEKLVGGEVLVHPSKVARMSFPQSDRHTTPIHQDFVHFQGSYHTLTLLDSAFGLLR